MNRIKNYFLKLLSLSIIVFIITSCSSSASSLVGFTPPSNGAGRNTDVSDNSDPEGPVLPSNGKTIIVDPGHGFRDPGAGAENYELGEGKDERYVTLKVAEFLKEELIRLGYSVIMTHEGVSNPDIEKYLDDNYFDPNERVNFVNSRNSDYFISLHCNLFEDSSVRGSKLYIYDNQIKANHDSEKIAVLISNAINSAFPDEREPTLDTFSYAVVREVTVPAVLIEMGFISSPEDAANLVDPAWEKTFAVAVASGIDSYFFPKAGAESTAESTVESQTIETGE